MQDYHEFLKEILIPEETIQKRICELGAQISQDYKSQELIMICILRGAMIFFTDLIRHITVPLTVDFLAVSSYGVGARHSTGRARITLDLNTNIQDCHVLLVEDIVDSGYTIKAVLDFLETRRPSTLRVCTLLDKQERREVAVPIHYRGFVIPDKFVFGYGLDVDEFYRNLPFIGVLDLENFDRTE